MDDFAAYYKWFVGVALGLVGFFVRDLHSQYKDHLKESAARENRIVTLEANSKNVVDRLDDIANKLDRLIERGK